jgi:hypothetical protein
LPWLEHTGGTPVPLRLNGIDLIPLTTHISGGIWQFERRNDGNAQQQKRGNLEF